MNKLPIDDATRLLVLTGSGISAESGLPTYRGAGGLWNNIPFEQLASQQGFDTAPDLVWKFYSDRRALARRAEPNPGHLALAYLEQRLGDRFLMVTQNVDELHFKATSRRVVELHGNLFRTKCSNPTCSLPPSVDFSEYAVTPRCSVCGSNLRPDVVWFGEPILRRNLVQINNFLKKSAGTPTIFLAVGTSGAVEPAAHLVTACKESGATTILVNAEPPDNLANFDIFVQGQAGSILPRMI